MSLDVIDPIHGFIRLTPLEHELVDSAVFQRLRRIKQLSGAHLTYPGAQHTRFEHSLGVMHIAGQAGQSLYEKGMMDEEDIVNLRLAGLLHDVGHGPFSHLFEEVMQGSLAPSHEEMGRRVIVGTVIGDILTKAGHNKDEIAALAFGESNTRYMNEIISGILSADMMDYIQRDGYFTGAEHAKIDHNRIIRSFQVYEDRLALEKSARYSFESMIHSRYQMFKTVYFHKTVRAVEVMLLEAIRLAEPELALASINLDEYTELTDESVMTRLLSLESKPGQLGRAGAFARDCQDRRLIKCVYENIDGNVQADPPDALRSKIALKAGVKEDEVFVDSSSIPSVPLAFSKQESQSVVLIHGGEGREVPIKEMPLVSAMAGFMDILRVYAARDSRKKVEIAARAILGGTE